MKVFFIHDATFKYDEEGKYYGTSVNPKTMSRYKFFSENITVLIRTVPFMAGESRDKYTEITDDFRIVHCENYMSLKGMLFVRPKVKRKVEKMVEEADIVFARFSGETGKMAVRICKKLNKPYVIECVGCCWDSLSNYGIKGKLLAPFIFLTTRILIKNAKYVVYVTEKFLQKRYPTNGKSISASNVELIEMSEDVLRSRIDKINELHENDKLILGTAAAVNVPYKGQAYVIKAIALLKKSGYKFEYHMIGTGDCTKLKNLAIDLGVEAEVVFDGVLKQNSVFEWIDKLDIYIQPSDQEGLPRALIEAMSRACPSIGSLTGGIPELLDNFMIFKCKHINELIKILKSITPKILIAEAKKNYDTALGYRKDVIYKRRNEFYDLVTRENNLR